MTREKPFKKCVLVVGEAPGCFIGGTPVFHDNGVQYIEEDSTDLNVTKNLRYSVLEYPGVKLRVEKFPEYTCTSNHKILVIRRDKYKKNKIPKGAGPLHYVRASEIDLTDGSQYFVMVPKLRHTGCDVSISPLACHKRSRTGYNDKYIPDRIQIDEDMAFVLGAYLGDGSSSVSGGQVTWHLSTGYKEAYVDRICNTLRRFGTTPTVRKHGKNINIHVYSRTIASYFLATFGKDAYTKVVPNFIGKCDKEVISSFLFGWYITDGGKHKSLQKGQRITTVSPIAAWAAVSLGLKCGVLLGVNRYVDNRAYAINHKPVYNIGFNTESLLTLGWDIPTFAGATSSKYGQDDDFYYLRITRADRVTVTGDVYDKTTIGGYYDIPFRVHNSNEDIDDIQFHPEGACGRLLRKELAKRDIADSIVFTNAVRCLWPETKILTDAGWMTVRSLVIGVENSHKPPKVLGFNTNTHSFEWSCIDKGYRSRLEGRRWVKVSHNWSKTAGPKGRAGAIVTNDHQFLCKGGEWVNAENLNGRLINIGPYAFTGSSKSVVVGTLLGDGTIGKKTSYLSCTHSEKQLEWCSIKAKCLGLTVAKVPASDGHRRVRLSTSASPYFSYLRSLTYQKNSKIRYVHQALLDMLDIQALAVWFLDDGYTRSRAGGRRDLAELAVCRYDDASVARISKKLDSMGFPNTIKFSKYSRIYFDADSTHKLLKSISPFVPDTMRYKLGKVQGVSFDERVYAPSPMEAMYAEARAEEVHKRTDLCFCISVPTVENFLTYAGVAHNCRPPNNELKTKKEVKACRTFLIEDIERLRPRAILLLGNKALFSLTGKEGITKRRRQLMHHKLMDGTEIPMMAGFHPSYAIRDRNNLPAFQEDIDTFISMLNGEVEDQAAIESRILGKYTSDASEIDVHRMHQRAKVSGGLVSFDVETNSLSPYLSPDTFRITMLSLSDGQETLVVRLDSVTGKVDKSPALKAALHLLMDKSIGKIAHNGKYDMSAIWVRYGVEVKNLAVDTMLLHALMHAINTSHALEDLSMDMLGVTAYHEKTTHKSKATKGVPVADKWLAMATDEDLIRRAALDAACTYRIYEKLWAEALEEDARFLALNIKGYKITDVFSHIVMPCSYTLFCMERNGFPVDIDAAKALEASYQERLDAVTEKLKRMKHVRSYVEELRSEYMESPKALKDEVKRKERSLTIEFNPGSAQQVAAVLNRHYKIPDKLFNVTKTGLLSADTETLSRIETSKHKDKCAKFMAALREFRHLDKGLSTYLTGIIKRVGPDRKVHSTYRQDTARTGRLASRSPNLQNSSKKHKDIRAIFKAPDGYSIIEGDYSQIELRILAAESGDKTLVRTYREGADIHDETARDIWKIPYGKEVPDDIRTKAKCFHPKTEVLTRSGWKKIDDLHIGEEIVQATPIDKGIPILEWTVPTEVFTMECKSSRLVHLQNMGIDLSVTDDHRMLAYTNRGYSKVVHPLDFGKQRFWANAGNLHSSPTIKSNDNMIRLCVAIQADGSYTKDGAIRFGFSKQRKVGRLIGLLERCGIPYTIHKHTGKNGSKVTTIRICAEYSKEFIRVMPHKVFEWALLGLSHTSRVALIDELQYWDCSRGKRRAGFTYISSVRQNADVVQAIASTIGIKTRISEVDRAEYGWSTLYRVSINNKWYSRGENLACDIIKHSGHVSCLSVPSSFVLVRDNGVPIITGQSVNFGIVYMISAFGLIRQIGGTEAECQRRINAVYKRFPGVKRWQNSTIRFAESQGRAYSLFGHWRDLQNAKYKPKRGEKEGWSSYKEATRQAVNAPIQGAAGFVMFVSMNKLLKVLRKMKLSKYAKIVNTVHDSLMLLVKDSHLNKVMKIMKEVMESEPVRWLGDSLRGIPIQIDLKVGKSWDAMQKVKVD